MALCGHTSSPPKRTHSAIYYPSKGLSKEAHNSHRVLSNKRVLSDILLDIAFAAVLVEFRCDGDWMCRERGAGGGNFARDGHLLFLNESSTL